MTGVRTINNFFEKSEMIREIESECLRAERNEKVNLIELKEKLSKLTEKLQKSPSFASHSSGLQDKELAVLQNRVNALSKTDSSARVKPVLLYTACAIAGIAIVWMGLSLFSSSTPTPPPPPGPTPPQSPEFNYNELAQKTKGGDCEAFATLRMYWSEGMLSTPESDKTQLYTSYETATHSQYENLVKQASNGDLTAMVNLVGCWKWKVQDSIVEAYYTAHHPNYRTLKQQAIDGNPTSMNELTSFWKKPGLFDAGAEKFSIKDAFASKIRTKAKLGETHAFNLLESKWQDGSIWDSEQAQSAIRQGYYKEISKKVSSGDTEAFKILTTAWYDGKTSVGIELKSDPSVLLSNYYQQHPEEWKQAQQGDLKTMIGLFKIWYLNPLAAPSYREENSIITAFESAFSQHYQDLIQKTESGDKSAMDAMKRIWWECEQLIPQGHRKFCSTISISEEKKKSIREAYNLFRVPDYLQLQKKASEGDDAAMSTLKSKSEDGTLDVLESEKEAIQTSYDFIKSCEQKIAEASSGDWEAMSLLKSYWERKLISHTEALKSSIEANYNAAFRKKYQEVMETAKNGQYYAKVKLLSYWEGNSRSNEHLVEREDFYPAVIPDYKNLKEKMLEGGAFAKSTLTDPDHNVFLSQAERSFLIEGYWAAQVSKMRKGDVSAKFCVDLEQNTGRFDAETLVSIYNDFWESRGKIEQANKANQPTRKKKS